MNRLLSILAISIATFFSGHAFAQEVDFAKVDSENAAKCNAGDGEACLRRSKSNDDKWLFKAATYLSAECDKGNAKSCILATDAYARMLPRPEGHDPKTYLEKACEAKSPEGCRKLADHYLREDNEEAADTFKLEACRLGDGESCRLLVQFATFKRRLDPSSGESTYKTLAALCELDRPDACVHVGRSFREGFGVTKDEDAAYASFSKACRLGSRRGCAEEAGSLLFGVGIKANREKAHPRLQKLCHSDKPDQLACGLLGWSALSTDTTEAVKLMETSCASNHGQVCELLGIEYFSGHILPRDTDRAISTFNKGCKAGSTASCRVLAAILADGEWTSKDTRRAAGLAKTACARGDALACFLYGDLHRKGDGLPKDPILASAYYEKSCNIEAPMGCNAYAWHQCHDRNICTSKELEAIERALLLDKDGSYHNTHGLVLCKMGKTKEARAAYKKACAKNKDLCESTCPAK